MIPPPRKQSKPMPPARREQTVVPAGFIVIQPNRSFDNEEEIMATYPNAKIVKTWKSNQIHCQVMIPEPKKQIPTKKTK